MMLFFKRLVPQAFEPNSLRGRRYMAVWSNHPISHGNMFLTSKFHKRIKFNVLLEYVCIKLTVLNCFIKIIL